MALHPKGFDLSLGRVRRLLGVLGDPQDRLPPTIHIAGTNGKGSCAAFCRALLEAAGLRTHVHTSPHLVRWHERFRLGGNLVDDALLAETVRRVASANGGARITVFEILTAVMFVLFSEQPADAAVLEVGLGGRADATNVITRPRVSVITQIGLDHQAYLGDTVELIAGEKAGIMKPGVPVVIGAQTHPTARDVLIARAEALGCPAIVYGEDFLAFEEHGRMVYQDAVSLLDLPLPGLRGRHQLTNAAAAIAAVRAGGFEMSEAAMERAMAAADWPARMQRLDAGRLVDLAPPGAEIWLDGGHNRDGALMVAEFVAAREEEVERPLFLIAAMLASKDAPGYFSVFEGLARHVFTVPVPGTEAGADPGFLADQALAAGLSAEPMDDVPAALRLLTESWNGLERPPRIVICGSLYLAGEVLRANGTLPD
ncbi:MULTISPECIES: folylpolyglutamate synthase/dihydrofolate synthase family protein [unclassified Roseitalea]|uniref:bifunctional folylpolyglutamate synthase/dihydrofolate synthase n=1 Tax=unclassified Roseitalea TaxID=2639107 RepID=UPI00273E2DF6|nr:MULTISPECIES: folylpolyglutamate synthase/dihydrofolate synthase family protein [unclassified Roseitalea]